MPVQVKEVCSVCGRKKDGLVLPHEKRKNSKRQKAWMGAVGMGMVEQGQHLQSPVLCTRSVLCASG